MIKIKNNTRYIDIIEEDTLDINSIRKDLVVEIVSNTDSVTISMAHSELISLNYKDCVDNTGASFNTPTELEEYLLLILN